MQEQMPQLESARKNLIFFWIIAAILVVVIIGGLYWWISAGKAGLPESGNEKGGQSESQNISGWQAYKNEKYGFSLVFPDNWENYIVSDATADWGTVGKTDVILFGFEQKKDMFAVYPFSSDQASYFGEDKLNPVSFLGPVSYLGESEKYVFYSESSQSENNGDPTSQKLKDVESILDTFSLK